MRTHKLNNAIAIALGCVALAMITVPAQAAVIKANAGTTFVLSPVPGHSDQLTHSIDGIVRVTILGNCTFHGDVLIYLPTAAGKPISSPGPAGSPRPMAPRPWRPKWKA